MTSKVKVHASGISAEKLRRLILDYSAVVADESRAAPTRMMAQEVLSQLLDVMPVDDGDLIVFTVGAQRITRRVATNLFNMVAPQDNWKNPIDAIVTIYDESTLTALERSITFFTGSVAQVSKLGSGRYHILAAGYYATIGA